MQQMKSTQTGVYERETLRTKQSDDLELFAAVCETESASAAWLADQRINADRGTWVYLS